MKDPIATDTSPLKRNSNYRAVFFDFETLRCETMLTTYDVWADKWCTVRTPATCGALLRGYLLDPRTVFVGYNNKNFERITHYQDMLGQGAFGSYRSLLEQVTLHPAMGTYLSHLANQKAVTYKNAQGLQVSVVPDENYAREVMQLFSIGLVERNPDFSPVLDANGATKATYDQSVIAASTNMPAAHKLDHS